MVARKSSNEVGPALFKPICKAHYIATLCRKSDNASKYGIEGDIFTSISERWRIYGVIDLPKSASRDI
ncbi:MAG: hypothetical protein ACLP4V_23245 [Methylocella sp.]